MDQHTHERLSSGETHKPGSERSFGWVMAGAFAVFGSLNWWHDGRMSPLLGGIAVVFAMSALVYPPLLKPLNWAWFKFGLLLHAIVNPIVMGLLFVLTVTPTALIIRLRGEDLLRLKREPALDSYWIARRPPGPSGDSLKDQF